MIKFNPECHTYIGHIFHPDCFNLSESSQTFYNIAGIALKLCTFNIAHTIHHYRCHNHTPLLGRVSASSQLFDECLREVSQKVENFDVDSLYTHIKDERSKLEALLMDHHGYPWDDEKIIEQFDLTFKLALLFGKNTLEMCYEEAISKECSVASLLTSQDGHNYYRNFFAASSLYELVRGCITYVARPDEQRLSEQGDDRKIIRWLKPYYEAHKCSFYEEGSKRCEWRTLYNSWCRLVYTYVNEDELAREDKRFLLHTQEDVHPCYWQSIGMEPS